MAGYSIGVVNVPQLRRVTALQTHLEEIGAGGAVGEQRGFFTEQFFEGVQ